MAEVVGLVTAIGTIVSTGFKIARAVSATADEFGTASNKVKCIAIDTKAVVMILRQIKSRLVSGKTLDTETTEVLAKVLTQCKADIDDIQRCLVPLVVIAGDSMTIKQKLRWLFSKSKISGKQASLDSLKLTLTLFLHMMDFADGEDVEDLKEEIENAVIETKKTKIAFLTAERLDRAAAKAFEPTETQGEAPQKEVDKQAGGNLPPRASIDWTESSTPRPGELVPLSWSLENSEEPPVSSKQSGNLAEQQLELLKTSEFDLIDSLSDDEFLNIAEHIRLQKAVTSLALVVLHRQREPKQKQPRKFGNEYSSTPISPNKVDNGKEASYGQSESSDSDSGVYGRSRESPSAQASHTETQSDTAAPPGERRSQETSAPFNPMHSYASYPDPMANSGEIPGQNTTSWHPFYDRYQARYQDLPPWAHQSMPHPSFTSMPFPRPGYPESELEKLRSQLRKYKEEKAERVDREKQAKLEAEVRKDAERAFQQRMEEMRRAQEEARREIGEQKAEAERTARARIEAEREAEGERRKLREEAMKRAERDARDKLEAELKATEERTKKEAESALEAEAAAAARQAEVDEFRKKLKAEAMLKAEIETRERLEREKKAAEESIEAKSKFTKKKAFRILAW